jgi:catechol 2,3-dioxygenase
MADHPMPPFSIHPDTHVGSVALTVASLERGLDFYQGVLGLNRLTSSDRGVELGVDSTRTLVTLVEVPGARPKPSHTTGLYHFAIRLPVREALGRFLRHLLSQAYRLQGAADHGVSEALYLADPEGNGIEVYTDKPAEEWPWQGEHLRMTTDPLNVDDLLAAAPGPWSGAPSGSSIGHVHLHVSDLDQAQHFYCTVLGFDLMQRFGASALFVSAGGYHHHIGLNTWAGTGAPAPPSDAVGLRYYTLILPNQSELDQVAERLESAHVAFDFEPAQASRLVLQDPASNGIVVEVA